MATWNRSLLLDLHVEASFVEGVDQSLASKSPVTSKVSDLGLAVSPMTPLTSLTASLIPLVQDRQQLWTPVKVRLVTFPLVTPLSSREMHGLGLERAVEARGGQGLDGLLGGRVIGGRDGDGPGIPVADPLDPVERPSAGRSRIVQDLIAQPRSSSTSRTSLGKLRSLAAISNWRTSSSVLVSPRSAS